MVQDRLPLVSGTTTTILFIVSVLFLDQTRRFLFIKA